MRQYYFMMNEMICGGDDAMRERGEDCERYGARIIPTTASSDEAVVGVESDIFRLT